VAALVAVFVWIRPRGSDVPVADLPQTPGGSAAQHGPTQHGDAGAFEKQTVASSGSGPKAASAPVPPKPPHPLLENATCAVLADGIDEVTSTAGPELAAIIPALARSGSAGGDLAQLTIDYPQDDTIFPPEIVPPTFLWHEPDQRADTWLIDLSFGDGSQHVYALSPGDPPPAGPIDPKAISEKNELYEPTPYQASAKSWTPSADIWAAIKRCSTGAAASVDIIGFSSAEPSKALSRSRIAVTTSNDPVGAPIFYRDVPLNPSSQTEQGVIKPLSGPAVTLIAWRLRDISRPQSRLVLTDVPRCTNCHSFSADGKTLGMDLDGPDGDKGTYVIAPVSRQIITTTRTRRGR
jgi:hypothetical protein